MNDYMWDLDTNSLGVIAHGKAHLSKNWTKEKQDAYNAWYYQTHKYKWADNDDFDSFMKAHGGENTKNFQWVGNTDYGIAEAKDGSKVLIRGTSGNIVASGKELGGRDARELSQWLKDRDKEARDYLRDNKIDENSKAGREYLADVDAKASTKVKNYNVKPEIELEDDSKKKKSSGKKSGSSKKGSGSGKKSSGSSKKSSSSGSSSKKTASFNKSSGSGKSSSASSTGNVFKAKSSGKSSGSSSTKEKSTAAKKSTAGSSTSKKDASQSKTTDKTITASKSLKERSVETLADNILKGGAIDLSSLGTTPTEEQLKYIKTLIESSGIGNLTGADAEAVFEKIKKDSEKVVSHADDGNGIYYGIPEQKKFPLDTRAHVVSAVKFFNWAEPQYRKELATRLIAKIKEYNIKLSPTLTNKFYNYYSPEH